MSENKMSNALKYVMRHHEGWWSIVDLINEGYPVIDTLQLLDTSDIENVRIFAYIMSEIGQKAAVVEPYYSQVLKLQDSVATYYILQSIMSLNKISDSTLRELNVRL